MSLLPSDFLSCIHSTSGKTDEGMHERKPSMLSIVAADCKYGWHRPRFDLFIISSLPLSARLLSTTKKGKKKEETGDVIGHNLGVATQQRSNPVNKRIKPEKTEKSRQSFHFQLGDR